MKIGVNYNIYHFVFVKRAGRSKTISTIGCMIKQGTNEVYGIRDQRPEKGRD